MNDTLMTLVGNVVNDVQLRYTGSGHPVASFRVANGTRRYDKSVDRWVDSDTHFFNVTLWRETALNAAESITKGMPVVVHGRLRSRELSREFKECGHTHNVVYHDIEAFAVGPNLARGTASFVRQSRQTVVENEQRAAADDMMEREGFPPVDDDVVETVDLETGEITAVSAA